MLKIKSLKRRDARMDALKTVDIRPQQLIENIRAGLFPEQAEETLSRVKTGVVVLAVREVEQIEQRLMNREKVKMKVVRVEALEQQSTPLTPMEHLMRGSPPWGLLQVDAGLVASERWVVRCKGGQKRSYRMNYYRDDGGNLFYPKALPLDLPSAVAYATMQLRNIFG